MQQHLFLLLLAVCLALRLNAVALAASPPPRVANAILGPAGAAQLENILAEQLKVQGASLREMIREVVQSELDSRGVTQLGVTAGQMLNA